MDGTEARAGGGEGARTGDGVCAGGGEGEETRAESLTAPVVLRMPIRAEEGLSIKIFDMCLFLDAQGTIQVYSIKLDQQ